MALYETVFITRQDLAAEDVDALSVKFSKIITEGKGKVVSKEYWGLRNLAYKIKKNSRGHYVLLNIDADFSAISELNRVIGFNEDVIRSVTIKMNPKHAVEESQLFLCSEAKQFKPGIAKKDSSKYDSILDQAQFDNII